MLQTWPPFFPPPQRSGNSRSPADLSVRSQAASGLSAARRRFQHVRDACRVSFVLTDDQLAAFDAWWHYTMAQGCAWFLLILEGETGQALHSARMGAGYQADSLAAARWRVTAALELDAPPRLSADEYAGMVMEGLDISVDAAALHQLVHVDLPQRLAP